MQMCKALNVLAVHLPHYFTAICYSTWVFTKCEFTEQYVIFLTVVPNTAAATYWVLTNPFLND